MSREQGLSIHRHPQAVDSQALRLENSKSRPDLTPELSPKNRQRQADAACAAEIGITNRDRTVPPRDPPSLQLRMLAKPEVLLIAGVSYVTLWSWMRAGAFPRARIVGGKSMWRSDEVEAWLEALPVRPLKGDFAPDHSGKLQEKTG